MSPPVIWIPEPPRSDGPDAEDYQENGQNLVLVTHDANIASYADRIVNIFDGNIEGSQLIKGS
jgi:ABC-type polysaccharide/polyol phosphate transport system ATPase subunit